LACLLTWLGTFVCYDQAIHRIVHVTWTEITETCPLVDVTLIRALDQRVVAADLDVARNDPVLGPGPVLHQRLIATQRGTALDSRIVSLNTGTHFLCADPFNHIVADREEASDWEHFLVIEPEEVADLLDLLGNRWVLRSTGAIIERSAIKVLDGFQVQFGPLLLRLSENLPLRHARRFDGTERPQAYQVDLFVDGWKVERASLYRPLVYFTAFVQDDVFEQLRLALRSLVEFGDYDGDVLILSDRTDAVVRGFVPDELQARTVVRPLRVRRGLDYMIARYRVGEWPAAARFQPLLYADTDTVFDAPIGTLLAELASHPLISFPRERTGLAASPQLGQLHVEADGIDVGDRLGFNSGTMGLPNLTLQGGPLRLILDAIGRWDVDQIARDAPVVWEDQPMANYIAAKTGCVDTALMSRFVRFDHPDYRDGPATAPNGARGMVHFWGPPTYREKVDLMEAYIEALRADRQAGLVAASMPGLHPAWPRPDGSEPIPAAVPGSAARTPDEL
jgi:hypothetical protein